VSVIIHHNITTNQNISAARFTMILYPMQNDCHRLHAMSLKWHGLTLQTEIGYINRK